MDITILEASSETIPVIQDLARACYMIAYRGIHSEEQNRYMMNQMYSTESLVHQMENEGSKFLLLYLDESPSAYCAYKPYSGNEHGEGELFEDDSNFISLPIVYLDKLYVLPGLKGKGLGSTLVSYVLQESKKKYPDGCIVRLDVNKVNSAKIFYEKLGFKVVRQWDAPIGEGFVMNGITMDLIVK